MLAYLVMAAMAAVWGVLTGLLIADRRRGPRV